MPKQLEVGDELAPGIVQMAKVYVAKKRKLKVGDKMRLSVDNLGEQNSKVVLI